MTYTWQEQVDWSSCKQTRSTFKSQMTNYPTTSQLTQHCLLHICHFFPGCFTFMFVSRAISFIYGKIRNVPTKDRPIKIMLKSASEVNPLMAKFSTLNTSTVDITLANVSLTRDRTPRQMKYLKDLREELTRRSESEK
ncbi:hypothetical protein J6590_099268 [Homalodisca vitripennis]|nr:hypothetical protein J6590_099268 [Homalodisca vitripennis]